MSSLEIVPATPALLRQYYGTSLPWTVRGYVAIRDGEIVGVGGLAKQDGGWLAFSEHTPALGRKDAARCARFMERVFATLKVPVIAECQGSQRLLERLGFRATGEVGAAGPLMVRFPWAH